MERRESLDKKKEQIKKDPKDCLENILLKFSQSQSDSDPEMLEWAMAFAEYFDEHPELWSEAEEAKESKSSDPLVFKSFKEKLENFLDLFRKIRPK